MVTPPASILRSDPGYRFDFCGGELAIDFTNTGSRGADAADHLRTFGDLMAWAEARTVVTPEQARRLRRAAGQRPAAARAALAGALELREALYRVITAAAGTRTAADADLAILNAHVRRTFSRMRLTPARARLDLTIDEGPPASLADAVLTPIVRAGVDLLTSDAIARVRQCADASCAWLFLDTTRNRTRRWCDMKACGNRSKVRRFRAGSET